MPEEEDREVGGRQKGNEGGREGGRREGTWWRDEGKKEEKNRGGEQQT